jgi:hypothetical protein
LGSLLFAAIALASSSASCRRKDLFAARVLSQSY